MPVPRTATISFCECLGCFLVDLRFFDLDLLFAFIVSHVSSSFCLDSDGVSIVCLRSLSLSLSLFVPHVPFYISLCQCFSILAVYFNFSRRCSSCHSNYTHFLLHLFNSKKAENELLQPLNRINELNGRVMIRVILKSNRYLKKKKRQIRRACSVSR